MLIEGNLLESLDLSLMNDQELMQLLVEENLGAWSEIVKRYGNLVYSIAYQILKNSSDTEDAVQNTFIRLKIYSSKFDHSLPVKPWLSRIASGEAIRLYNQKKNIHKKESGRMETQSYTINSPKSEVSARMEQKELEVMVKKAIEVLPELSRVAVTLYFVGGMNQSEIAKELGMSQFSISEKINSGLEKIKAFLKKSGIHASIALSPSLLQESISSQILPVELTEKLTHSMPTKSQIANVQSANDLAGKSFVKKILTSYWFLSTCAILFTGIAYLYFHNSNITITPTTNLPAAKKMEFVTNISDKKFNDVDLKNYIPVYCKFVQFNKNDNLPDIIEGQAQVEGGEPKWKVTTNKKGLQSVVRDLDSRDVLDGLYLREDFYRPQVFTGTIKVNSPRSKISFLMSTPMAEKKFNAIGDIENKSFVYSRRTGNISAMQADAGNIIDFVIYLFPVENKLISISIVYCKGLDFSSVVTKQLEFVHHNSFKMGVISNGKVEISNFKQCDLGENWDYRREKNILDVSADLPKDFFDKIVVQNTEAKFKKH